MLKWTAITQRASRAQDNFITLVGKKHTIRSSDLGSVAPQLFRGAVPACGEGASLRTARRRRGLILLPELRGQPRSCGGEGRLGLPTASAHFLGEACLVSVIQAGPGDAAGAVRKMAEAGAANLSASVFIVLGWIGHFQIFLLWVILLLAFF